MIMIIVNKYKLLESSTRTQIHSLFVVRKIKPEKNFGLAKLTSG
jgi:hypothetical protein